MDARKPEDARQLANELADFLRPAVARIATLRTLSSGKVGVLRHLSVHERASGAELAEAIGVSAQAISLVTKELQGLAYIERQPDESDRRRTWFVLTEQGRDRLAAEIAVSRGWLASVIEERLTAAERAELAAVMPLLDRLVADR
ncbi:MarR family winged helix-turn-helix transcriptional regulator [Nocardioides sp. Bht2]|uniref:MarR family winged helix-turn-helix transcriptional regulator n=1 Tax=Nocardioides sp. Bht2 TaxID=3392297 RepID=UPI0039B67A53